MSSPVAHASASYATILQHAQKAYDTSKGLLNSALADKSVEGSIAHQADQLDTQVKTMKEANRSAETYPALKDQFIQFMGTQLDKYVTAQKARESGLKAIETVKASQATCTAFKQTPAQTDALMHHLVGLNINASAYTKKQEATNEAVTKFGYEAKVAELTESVAKVSAQITVLEGSLDKAFFEKKSAEGKTGYIDMLPSFNHSYLLAAVAEKNKPAEVVEAVVEGPKPAPSNLEAPATLAVTPEVKAANA